MPVQQVISPVELQRGRSMQATRKGGLLLHFKYWASIWDREEIVGLALKGEEQKGGSFLTLYADPAPPERLVESETARRAPAGRLCRGGRGENLRVRRRGGRRGGKRRLGALK